MQTNYITIILGLLATIILFYKLPKLRNISGKTDKNTNLSNIKVSVIIPARNEENNLPNILGDLMKQNYPIHEIICVDDGSTDKTPDIIGNFEKNGKYKVIGIGVSELPVGWKGKTWACQNGAKAATGELLLFLDSDVRLSYTAVESLVYKYMVKKQPISIQPYHIVKKQHEYFSLFFNLIQSCATGMTVLGKKKTQGFYGPTLMIKKEQFDEFGGYEPVRDKVIEDFDLGKYLGKRGIDVELLLGGSEVSYRMYERNFKDLIEGWSKNFSRASISMKWWLLVVIVIWVAYLTALPFEIGRVIAYNIENMMIIFGIIYLISIILIYRVGKAIGSYPIFTCLLYPIYLLGFHLIFLNSIIKTFILKSTTWKGRKL